MSTFDNQQLEVPEKSVWHQVSGWIVLTFGSLGGVYGVAWLLLV
jgi:hypothetical protein